jgi:ribonuclease BN (tRNA processing enzyme)
MNGLDNWSRLHVKRSCHNLQSLIIHNFHEKFSFQVSPFGKGGIKTAFSFFLHLPYNISYMKLTILGSGTCVPSLRRNASGYLLEAEGREVLIDCGSGILLQLEKAGKSYKDIDALFLTHGHPDHFADLMPMIHALFYTPNFTRSKDFSIIAPRGFKQYYNRAIGSILGESMDFRIVFMEAAKTMEYGPWSISTTETMHSDDSIAYRFEQEAGSVVFSGDADYDKGIIDLSEKADLLIADCSFPDAMKVKGHLSAKECGLLAHNADVKKLVLSHIYPVNTPEKDRVSEAKEHFNGDVILAEDLMEIII